MAKPKVIIVNKEDQIIDHKSRSEIKSDDLIRVTRLDIFSGDKVLIAQRSFKKKNSPGKWGPSVAGTVEEGETYLSNIIKEAYEELGLSNISPIFVEKVIYNYDHTFFCSIYKLNIDINTKLTIQEGEVESVKWISIDQLKKDYQSNPNKYIPPIRSLFE